MHAAITSWRRQAIHAVGKGNGRGTPVAVARYLALIVAANLVWETVQLPLYTLWREGSSAEIAYAVLHCTAGDVLIALGSLAAAVLAVGIIAGRRGNGRAAMATATVLGVAYTIFSEWLNTAVRGSWAYGELMPVLPPLGTGLSPLLQWFLLPPLCFMLARTGGAAVKHRRIGANIRALYANSVSAGQPGAEASPACRRRCACLMQTGLTFRPPGA